MTHADALMIAREMAFCAFILWQKDGWLSAVAAALAALTAIS